MGVARGDRECTVSETIGSLLSSLPPHAGAGESLINNEARIVRIGILLEKWDLSATSACEHAQEPSSLS